jgi:enoyl-CoA hydratase
MNLAIATYRKPIIALGYGAIMGGGIGIFGHARYRFTVPEARFAMPEAAIGFVCDIGVNATLAEAPEARALAFLMSGVAVGPADAIALGLCDAMIEAGRSDEVHRAIRAAAATRDPDSTLTRLMAAESREPGEAVLCASADALGAAFGERAAGEIVSAVSTYGAAIPGAAKLAAVLAARSPSSLEAILQSHRAARQLPSIAAVLQLDRRLAHYMSRQPDFAEGVRAVLIDKDQAPKWQPNTSAAVNSPAIAQVIAAPAPP